MSKGLLILILILGLQCSSSEEYPAQDSERIVVLGHTYRWGTDGKKVDLNVESADYSKYSQKWLLGDICSETVMDPNTINYLDDLFDLSNENTLWSVGNHDIRNGDINLITQKTLKPFHYKIVKNNNAFFVLNTQINHIQFQDSCDYKEKQFNEFDNILDNIIASPQQYQNLFILSHNTVWADLELPLLNYDLIGNVQSHGMDFKCTFGSQFKPNFGDKLKRIQNLGVQVYCIAGDGGQYEKTFYEVGESGIQYFVTGINNSVTENSPQDVIDKYNINPDSVLILNHNKTTNSFSAEFIPLKNL